MSGFLRALLVIVLAASAFGQAAVTTPDSNKLAITVTSSSAKDKVVLVEARQVRKNFELECQSTRHDCTALEAGEYWLVRLGSSTGVYLDCENADVYSKSSNGKNDRKLGEYCLLQGPD